MPGFGQIVHRGELVSPGNKIDLTIQFRDGMGQPIDTDSFPTITLMEPSGNIIMSPTTIGVAHTATGRYSFIYDIPIAGPYGVWSDIWSGIINGYRIDQTFNFVITPGDVPGPNTDGYSHLGDDIPFDYSQTAIFNINKIIKLVRMRLNSSGKAKKISPEGNVTYISCEIFSVDMISSFIAMALSEFNAIPYFTYFTFDDSSFIAEFCAILAEGAVIYALASQALIERGREFQLTDNGINFNPPAMSELLNTQFNTMLTLHMDKLKLIKNSMRPAPISMGRWGFEGVNPAFRMLRHRKAGQIY